MPNNDENKQPEKKPEETVFIDKNSVYIVAVVVLVVLLTASVFTGGFGISKPTTTTEVTVFTQNMAKVNEIKALLEDNIYLSTGQKTTAEFVNATEKSGFVTITFKALGQEIPIIVSEDYAYIHGGTPIAVNELKTQIDSYKAELEKEQPNKTANVQKTDKPVVELYIMTYCPYGTQTQKGAIPVIKALGDKVDFDVKFVDYIMHGEKEITENTRQYCIQKEQDAKYVPYLECFLAAGDSASCLASTGIDTTKLSACMAQTDTQHKITELYNDKNTWAGGYYPQYPVHSTDNDKYGVQGSPTLVINGKQVSAGRSPSAILSAICNHFNVAPAECTLQLSTTTPSSGFGYAAGSATDASCG